MAGSDSGSDYEHWPDDDKHLEEAAVASSGYDTHNGLRSYDYHPTNYVQAKEEAPPQAPAQPAPVAYPAPPPQYQPQLPPYMMGYPGMQYGYPPQMPCPIPAYYGYPGAPWGPQRGWQQMPQPAEEPEEKEEPKPEPPKVKKWQGRTKAEVEEDNMKIAKGEGANEERKVEPIGLSEDQVVWVVELDGSHTLRAHAHVKELRGEWKEDPRFHSWYFVREEEEVAKEKKSKKDKKDKKK